MIRALQKLWNNPSYIKVRHALRVLSVAVTLFILAPVILTITPTSGLDPSYQLGLLHALQKHLVFGTEYAFTYGPLAFALTRVAPVSLQWGIVLIDLSLLLALAHLLWHATGSLKSIFAYLLLPIAAIPIAGDIYFYQEVIVWFALLGFYLFLYLEQGRERSLAAAAAISLLILYLKLNFGLVTVPLVILFLLHCVFVEQRKGRFVLYLAIYCLVLILSASILNVSLYNYLISGWHLADSFNDAMFLDPYDFGYGGELKRALAVVAIFSLLLLGHLKSMLTDRRIFVTATFTALFLYLLFKQAFVRGDAHALLFAQFAPLTLLPLAVFSRGILKIGVALLLIVTVFLSAHQARSRYTLDVATNQATAIANYLAAAAHPKEPKFEIGPETAYLPVDLREIIGAQSIDIIPWESSIAYFHHLNYDPRPVFQTYQAYDPYLDSLNAEFYRSSRAPRFVLFQLACVDDRYCFGDELKTKLALAERYIVRKRSDPYLLLERRNTPLEINRIESDIGTLPLKQRINVQESDTLTILHLDIRYTFLGKIRRLLFQPPRVNIRYYLAAGGSQAFRGIVPILRGGILANLFVPDLTSAERFFAGRFSDLPRIEKISLETQSRKGLRQTMEYRVDKLTLRGLLE